MTIRAVILGLLGAMFVAAVAYLNDHVWLLPHFVASHFPVFVFGSLVVFALLVNPVLFLVRRNWRFRPAEVAVAVMFMLVACSIPNYGFLGVFTKAMVMPANVYKSEPGWEKNHLREYLPPHWQPAAGKYVPEFTDNFMQGGRAGGENISVADVPWHYWQSSLMTWMPLMMLMTVALICLGLILHKQWTQAERLRYPIADVATTLLEQDPNRAMPKLFRSTGFWWGLGLVLFIRVVNGVYAWFPENMIEIPLRLPFYDVADHFVAIKHADMWWWAWLGPMMYPTVIAIGFMLASDVGLSLGLAPPLFAVISMAFLKNFDLNIGHDDYMLGGSAAWQRFGSYVAMVLVIGYTGRRYYRDVLKGALTFRNQAGVPDYAAWACRIFFLAIGAFVMILVANGLPWPFAVLTVGMILLVSLGMSRINCESGLFLNLPRWQPIGIMVGLFGAVALGPKAIMMLALLSVVFTVVPWESLMPFFMNGLKMCSSQKIKVGRVGASSIGVYALSLMVALPVVLWAIHNYGVLREPPQWSTQDLTRYVYESGDTLVNDLKYEAKLSAAETLTTGERLGFNWGHVSFDWGRFPPVSWDDFGFDHIDPDGRFLRSAGIGLGIVLVVSFMRLRLPWWPLHPVLFMIWGTRQIAELSASFLVGWAIKSAVTNLGGTQTYQRTKVIMFGIIAGDLLGGLTFMAIALIYHLVTGKPAPEYLIFPKMM
ncbi:hypothetical protein LCGC14_0254330 [marine sediment metagenome]|uniref:Uncharacterized protein n=1 Tax=marine sediment metagenome TaxID=412755 RepID=A0A0F9UKM0_9ZZZZ|nr:hypothetical protein [Phycisphaerae bacterium]